MDGGAEEVRVFKSLLTDADKHSMAGLKQRLDALAAATAAPPREA